MARILGGRRIQITQRETKKTTDSKTNELLQTEIRRIQSASEILVMQAVGWQGVVHKWRCVMAQKQRNTLLAMASVKTC